MGFRFRRGREAVAPAGSSLALTARTDVLASLVFPDLPENTGPVSEVEALRVPSVARAVSLIAGTIAGLPRDGVPSWMERFGEQGAMTLSLVLQLTLKDLLLSPGGDALWFVDRRSGEISNVWYVRRDEWLADQDGKISINGMEVPDQYVIYFSAGRPGLCDIARDTIRQYRDLSAGISEAARMPHPRALIKETMQFTGSADEKDAAMKRLESVLKAKHGGIAWMPFGLEYQILDAAGIPAMSEARNAIRLDVANFVGIDPAMLAGTTGSSNIYSNALQGDREFSELTIKPWAALITERLAQADVGVELSFDFEPLERLSETNAAGNTGAPRKEITE